MEDETWVSCDLLVGRRLVDRDDAPLGVLEELIVDSSSGRVSLALVSRKRSDAGSDEEELVAVPWKALRVDQERDRVSLRVERTAFDTAPGFGPETPPDFSDQRWERDLQARFQ